MNLEMLVLAVVLLLWAIVLLRPPRVRSRGVQGNVRFAGEVKLPSSPPRRAARPSGKEGP